MRDSRSCNVAIVDNDDAVLDSYRFVLETAGFLVATYLSAIEYLESRDASARCMILDHHMPHMTGLELAAALRDRAVSIPILLVTSSPSSATVLRAAELGIVKVLEKPPEEQDLLQFLFQSGLAFTP